MACKMREEAREHFKKLGLSYSVIHIGFLEELIKILKEELELYLKNCGEHAQQMNMSVSKLRIKDKKFLKSKGLQYARIQIDGSYFERREGITFATSGFIGFGGEFSDVNVKPILKAFHRWCDLLPK